MIACRSLAPPELEVLALRRPPAVGLKPDRNASEIGPEEAHVWRIGLDEATADWGIAVLSPEERERASRFRTPELRRRFIAARAGLRFLLARYLGERPSALTFSYGPQGKPSLAPASTLSFSLSHSQKLALVAIASGCEIGIDVEELAPVDNAEQLARRFFSPTETRTLEAMDAASRSTAFLSGWVRKEAVSKALGAGLFCPLHEFDVPLEPVVGPSIVRTARPSDGGIVHWHVWDVPVGAGHVAALAASTGPRRISVRDWPAGVRSV